MDSRIKDLLMNEELYNRVQEIGQRTALSRMQLLEKLNANTRKVLIDGLNGKHIYKKSSREQGLAGFASANMYNKIDIQTPKIYLPKQNEMFSTRSFQRDISEVDGLEVVLAENNLEYQQIERGVFGKDKWKLFYDFDLQQRFSSFMTKECLEQLQNMYLVDELRSENDRWTQNFFLYRTKGAKKYEGVIAIDLEEMAIFNYCTGTKKADFDNFLYTSYHSSTPQQSYDFMCYADRIREILTLIDDGVLSKSNIEAITRAIKHDFPKEFEQACKSCNIHGRAKHDIVDPIKRLWEYVNNTIGKELE